MAVAQSGTTNPISFNAELMFVLLPFRISTGEGIQKLSLLLLLLPHLLLLAINTLLLLHGDLVQCRELLDAGGGPLSKTKWQSHDTRSNNVFCLTVPTFLIGYNPC